MKSKLGKISPLTGLDPLDYCNIEITKEPPHLDQYWLKITVRGQEVACGKFSGGEFWTRSKKDINSCINFLNNEDD